MGQTPNLRSFFNTLLPKKSQSEYYHLWLPNQGNIPCGDIEELIDKVTNFYQQTDCYFSLCSSRDSKHRRGQDLVLGKALAFDIDIKGIDSHVNIANYDNATEARAALDTFCNATKFIPTYIVQSGSGGLHVYFALTTEVTALARMQMQRALAKLAQNQFDLHIDPGALLITQVLRVPTTKHTKADKYVEIISSTDITYDSNKLYTVLNRLYPECFEEQTFSTPSVNRVPPRSRDTVVKVKGTSNFGFDAPSALYPQKEVYNVIYRCKHLAYMGVSGYKNWFGALSVLGHFEGGYECAKALSKLGGDNLYSDKAFENQWDNIILDRPQTCLMFEQFETVGIQYCKNCIYYNKIKSPITLHATTDINTVLPEVRDDYLRIFPEAQQQNTVAVSLPLTLNINNPIAFGSPTKFTPIPMSYNLNQIYHTKTNPYETFIVEEKLDKAGIVINSTKKRLFNGLLEFLFVEQFSGEYETKQSRYHFLVHTGSQEPYEIILEKFHNTHQVIDAIYDNGLIMGTAGEKIVANFLSAYTTEVMNSVNPPIQMASNKYGWREDNQIKGFLTDEGLITADKLIPAVVRGYSIKHDGANNRRFYGQGNLTLWQEAMNVYPQLNQQISQLVIMLSFASPLFSQAIPEIGSAILNLYGGSGIGKSTVLHAAMSVWGNPLNTSTKGSATAVQKLLGLTNNLPCCIEELLVTIKDPVQLGSLIFQLIDGTEKTRLSQKADIKEAATWSNAILCAANQPLKEALLAYTNAHNATQLRVIDIPFNVKRYRADDADLKLIKAGMTKFRDNFGLAGPLFIQWCLQNWREVLSLHKRIEGLLEKYNTPAEHRYLTYPLALAVLTCDLVKRAGILDWDFKALESFAFDYIYPDLILELHETVPSYAQQLSEFISSSLANNCVVVDHERLTGNEQNLLNQGQGIPNYVLVYPKNEAYIRWSVKDSKLAIKQSSFRAWAVKHNRSASNIINYVKRILKDNYKASENIRLHKAVTSSMQGLRCRGIILNANDLEKLGILQPIKEGLEQLLNNPLAVPQPVPADFNVPEGHVYIGDGKTRQMSESELHLYRALVLKLPN